MCKVVHCKKENYDVYIGRGRCPNTGKIGKWGNPFTHKAGTKANFIVPTRSEAILAYSAWIQFGDGKHLLKDLHELKGKTLGCWCAPQACHGDILMKLANEL